MKNAWLFVLCIALSFVFFILSRTGHSQVIQGPTSGQMYPVTTQSPGVTSKPAVSTTHPYMITDYSCPDGGELAYPYSSGFVIYDDMMPDIVYVDGKSYQVPHYHATSNVPVCVYRLKVQPIQDICTPDGHNCGVLGTTAWSTIGASSFITSSTLYSCSSSQAALSSKWKPLSTAPHDGTVVEILNTYGIAPTYGLFKYDAKLQWVQVDVKDRGLSDGNCMYWRSYTGAIDKYVDPTGGKQNSVAYWCSAEHMYYDKKNDKCVSRPVQISPKCPDCGPLIRRKDTLCPKGKTCKMVNGKAVVQ